LSDFEERSIVFTAQRRVELVVSQRRITEPQPGRVEGRTIATLVSPGTELAVYTGTSFPVHFGYAAVFEVERKGEGVDDLSIGDRVFCMGPHRSYQSCAREEVVPLPAGLRPEVALFARIMTVTMTTLHTTRVRPPEKVLVTGLGIVGNIGAQIFSSCGYDVIACEPNASRRKIARRSGIRCVLPGVPIGRPEVDGQVGLVVECSGHEQAVLDGCRVLRKGGELVMVGVPWKRLTDIYAHELLHQVFHRYITLRSGWEWQLPLRAADFQANSIYGNLAAALRWLAEGRVRVGGLYGVTSPSRAQTAYSRLLQKKGGVLTYIFSWSR